MKNKKKILIVVAHPDDEVLGCGGTAIKLIKEGHKVYSLILGEGITSRDTSRNDKKRKLELIELQKNITAANKIMGISRVFTFQFPDNRFDTVSLLDIVKIIESHISLIKPEIIFTHFEHDLNIDHSLVFKAVITATRPMKGQIVKQIYSFETLSSTEYKYPLSFQPDTFFDITDSISQKIDAMAAYVGELRKYPHPRSLKMIDLNAEYWGVRTGLAKAEAFKTIRKIC